ncbi:MAG: TlpA disulfide reductase family protein [Brachymonas sp.]|jgi:peroxiredoxin
MKPRRFLLKTLGLSAAVALILPLLGACSSAGEAAPQSRFVVLDGSSKSTADFKGKVWLVNFWATSCTTCVAEMPEIVGTYNKYKDKGYDTVAVAMDYDPPSYVVNFVQQRQLPFWVALDNTGQIARDWGGITATPTTFLIDKNGRIVKRIVGKPDFAQLHAQIEALL